MYSPTTRLLTLLELLQSRAEMSGSELAQRLEVDVRSVRRYVTMLRDMGIPVESEKGRYGAYRLRPGFRLPPLMFTNTEILAVILGLMAVRRLGMATRGGSESAAAKIERVLPDELREHVRSLQSVLSLDMPAYASVAEDVLARFSIGAYTRTRLWIAYLGGERGSVTERAIDVYGLVYHTGYWYAVAYCHLRAGLRVFRLDRVQQIQVLDETFTSPPDFDALDYLIKSIATIPNGYEVEVLLQATLEQAEYRVPPDVGVLEPTADGVLLRCYADGLEWMAHFLINTRLHFTVIRPPELRAKLREVAHAVLDMASDELGK